jgi:ATP-binding cassette subfamily B (MDR/TAP) protein 1
VGALINDFRSHGNAAVDREEFHHLLVHNVFYFIYLAIGEFVLIYIATVGFTYTSTHITSIVRKQYFSALLRQNIAFFDNVGTGEIGTRITADMNLFQDGIGHKVALTLTGQATFLTAFVVGFVKYWKLTLICLASVVAIMLVISVGGRLMMKYNQAAIEAYAKGGSVAEEILGSMRNATAFGTQEKLAGGYEKHLQRARRQGFIQKSVLALMIATIMCLVFLNYGFAFWMGSRFLVDGSVDVADILTIILAIIIGAFTFGSIGSNIQAFSAAIAASSNIYATIDRISPLDPSSDSGSTLKEVKGDLRFQDVKHIYPSRQDVIVLENCNLHIEAEKKTAIVGASGSGKSTIISLLERFYEPVGGTIFLDDVDISTLQLGWLRQQISLVEQEPKLFDETIMNNIRLGLIGSQYNDESGKELEERIKEAAKRAHAHDFIMQLPAGYQTQVSNTLLSGGQKQRIAIARAIVKDPKILLMDEPTSALDSESEAVVQAALEEASKNRTTVIVSHRQSTIAGADIIVLMQGGRIVQQGSRQEIMESVALKSHSTTSPGSTKADIDDTENRIESSARDPNIGKSMVLGLYRPVSRADSCSVRFREQLSSHG